jgi:hypothetical protein
MARAKGSKTKRKYTKRATTLAPASDEFDPLQMQGEPTGPVDEDDPEDEPPPEDAQPPEKPKEPAMPRRKTVAKLETQTQRDIKELDRLLPTGVRFRLAKRDINGKPQTIDEYTLDDLRGEPFETFVLEHIRPKHPEAIKFPVTMLYPDGREENRSDLEFAPIEAPKAPAPIIPGASGTVRDQIDLMAEIRRANAEDREREERALQRAREAQEAEERRTKEIIAAASNKDGGMSMMLPFLMMMRPPTPLPAPAPSGPSQVELLLEADRRQRERERDERPRPSPPPMLPQRDDGAETAKMVMEGVKTLAEILRPPAQPGLTRADVVEILHSKKDDGLADLVKNWGPTIVGTVIPLVKSWMDGNREMQQRLVEMQLQMAQQPSVEEKIAEMRALRDALKDMAGTDGNGGGFFDAIGKVAEKFLNPPAPSYHRPAVAAAPSPASPVSIAPPSPKPEDEPVVLVVPLAYMPHQQALLDAIAANDDGQIIGALMNGIQFLGTIPEWSGPLMHQLGAVQFRGKIALVEFVRGFLEGALMSHRVMTQEQVERAMVAIEANADSIVDYIKNASTTSAEPPAPADPAPEPSAA